MKKLLTFAATILAATFTSMSANAIVLDFVAEAAGAERGIANGSTITNFQGTGVDVTFTAGTKDWYPYFDDLSGGKPGGLGVCKNLFGSVGGAGDDGASDDCDPPSDDNVTVEETITLGFSGVAFALRDISFNDVDHNALGVAGNDGSIAIALDGGLAMVMLMSTAISMAKAGAFAAASSIMFGYVDTQFYISSISDVPIPGAIPLLISGLAGLGFAARRRKKA
ncbi:MAG: VPLPA-CTERM sorting domain-containing protein [Marinicaulis sp.]|nr:VPLPA-CTERM sorting domain-containing protein [Marinicaulis sp.]